MACFKTKFSKQGKQKNYPKESKGFKDQHEASIEKRDEEHVNPQQVDPDEFSEYSSNIWTVEQLSFELNVNNANVTESDRKVAVPLTVNGKTATFNLDTGAVVSCVGENTYKMFCKPGDNLVLTDLTLSDYNKKPIEVLGVARVEVTYENQSKRLPLVLVRGDCSPLFGRNWVRLEESDEFPAPSACSVSGSFDGSAM